MTWILQQLHYTQPWASERGGVEGVLGPSLLLKFEQKRLFAFSKKVFCEVSSWKMKFHRFCSPYENPWLHLENSIIANTLARTVWLIMDNCWTRVFWSGSTNICNRLSKNFRWLALKYCFELDIKSLIDLKIFCTTFGIGGGELSPLPPPGYALAMEPAESRGCDHWLFYIRFNKQGQLM